MADVTVMREDSRTARRDDAYSPLLSFADASSAEEEETGDDGVEVVENAEAW